MPSTQTITTFYSFSANSKARASEVNTNFSIFRGHIIPVEPLTQTSANITYDLGSTEYRWSNVYTKAIDFLSNTSTGAALKLYGETSTSGPAFIFSINNSNVYRVGAVNATTTASSGSYVSATTTNLQVTNLILTLTTYGGPVFISFFGETTSSTISTNTNVSNRSISLQARVRRDSTIISQAAFSAPISTTTSGQTINLPASALNTIDLPPAGTYVYSVLMGCAQDNTLSVTEIKMKLLER